MYKYLSADLHYAAFLPTGLCGLGMIFHSIKAAENPENQSVRLRLFWAVANSSCQA